MKIKLNNKGNTLAIVLIGIFILSILGTLILGVTSTNYRMKVTTAKTEKTFYYAEKAMDEVYAAIGNEVMQYVKTSYSTTVEEAVNKNSSGEYVVSNTTELHDKFKSYLISGKKNGITKVFDGLKTLYPEGNEDTDINDIYDRLDDSIAGVTGYTFELCKNNTEIVYNLEDENDIDTLKSIDFKNVCISCKASNGSYVTITTDFNITIPDIDMNFSDTESALTLEDFYTFALIAEGSNKAYNQYIKGEYTEMSDDLKNKLPALKVSGYKGTGQAFGFDINGNIYAGGVDGGESVLVEDGNEFVSRSKLIVCEQDFKMKNSTVKLDANIDGTVGDDAKNSDAINTKDTLQFYVKNISSEKGDSLKSGGLLPNLYIRGNCVVEDDLEVNAPNTSVEILGNYFGYGYRKNSETDYREADTKEITGFESNANTNLEEHKLSSAIIINESGASLDFTGLKKLVLAGRSYIDLNGGTNTSYMTGESVSFKGNQIAYLADASDLEKTLVAGRNGISRTELEKLLGEKSLVDSDGNVSYTNLGFQNPSPVIAKLANNSKVYFYKKPGTPSEQTTNFINYYNDSVKRSELEKKLKSLEVKSVKFPSNDDFSYYTVGTFLEVDNGKFSSTEIRYGAHQMNSTGFVNILQDIEKRKQNLVPYLQDDSDENYLGNSKTTLNNGTIDDTPYTYFLDDDFVKGSDTEKSNKLTENGTLKSNTQETKELVESIYNALGLTEAEKLKTTIGYYVYNGYAEDGNYGKVGIDFNVGIVITNAPVELNDDFTGMIITDESVTVVTNGDNKTELKANEEVAKLMFTNIDDLKDCLNDRFRVTEDDSDDDVVKKDGDSIKYTDLVEKSNWRKNQ